MLVTFYDIKTKKQISLKCLRKFCVSFVTLKLILFSSCWSFWSRYSFIIVLLKKLVENSFFKVEFYEDNIRIVTQKLNEIP